MVHRNSNFYQKKLGDLIDKVCLKVINQDSAILYHVTKNWQRIVGYELSKVCAPGRVSKVNSNFILTVHISHPAITLEVQSQENIILEGIARILGYRMVKKLRFKHVPNLLNFKPVQEKIITNAQKYKISSLENQNIEEVLSKIDNPELSDILQKLKADYFSE